MEETKFHLVKNWLFQFVLRRKFPLIFLGLGIILWIIQHNIQIKYGDVIPPSVTILRLLSYFFLILSPYAFLLKEKRYLLANFIVIGLIIVLFEGVCFMLLDYPDKIKKDFALPQVDADNIILKLGPIPNAETTIHDVKEKDGIKSFEVDYHIDEYSRRITPGYDSTRAEHALFFGCSISFGYGLEDNETLPYYFQENSNTNAKNYSVNGSGTNFMLARLQTQDLTTQVAEKNGAAYYVFFWDHIQRAVGTMDRYTSWVHTAPYFYLDNDKIVRDHTFKDGRYWLSKFYELVYQTSIVNYFKINFPTKISDRHYDLVSEMILESKKTYNEQFEGNEFYVVIYPSYKDYEEEEMLSFLEYLDQKNIKYIDLSNFVEYGAQHHLVGDPHPRAEFNKMIADELFKRIKELKKKE